MPVIGAGSTLALGVLVVALLMGAVPGYECCWDERLYREATGRWLEGGPFYLQHQVAGPYQVAFGDVLYPPSTLWLFVPLASLPTVVWYAVPLMVTAWGLVAFRPAWWAWPIILVLLAYEWTVPLVLLGNPVIWAYTFLWLGLRWHAAALGVLLKPTLAPFALVGAHRRRWWVALVVGVLAAVPFGAMWLDWLTVVTNARGAEYLARSVPLMCIPIVAWAGSRQAARRDVVRRAKAVVTGSGFAKRHSKRGLSWDVPDRV